MSDKPQPRYSDVLIAKQIAELQRHGLEIHIPKKGDAYFMKKRPKRVRRSV